MQAKLLAIDTSTEYCSVALATGTDVLSETVHSQRQHGAQILALVDALLANAQLSLTQLDALVVGRGPGSFTGVRMACSVVQGLAFGADRPVIPLSTLHMAAQAAYQQKQIQAALVALDARMQEVYYACFMLDKNGLMQLCGDEKVSAPERVCLPTAFSADYVGVGGGWSAYATALANNTVLAPQAIAADIQPHATAAIPLAQAAWAQQAYVPATQVLPIYLRDNVVH